MITSRKRQIAITLILVCTSAPILGAEPNEAKTELKFEISNEERQWFITDGRVDQGLIKPTHMAEFLITYSKSNTYGTSTIPEIEQSSMGPLMSQQQLGFIRKASAIAAFPSEMKDYYRCCLYAVSTDDAKKMVKAYVEALTSRANKNLQEHQTFKEKVQARIAELKKRILEKETKLNTVGPELGKRLKEGPYALELDPNGGIALGMDIPDRAKKAVSDMNKMLDVLNIEIAGLQAKLAAIEDYRSKKNIGTEALAKLEQILCEQTIELAGALARKRAALEIRKREEEFYSLYTQWENTSYEVQGLKRDLGLSEHNLKLAKPGVEMLPPQVFENRVIIYPVRP
jgi:prefoldin subunit 5